MASLGALTIDIATNVAKVQKDIEQIRGNFHKLDTSLNTTSKAITGISKALGAIAAISVSSVWLITAAKKSLEAEVAHNKLRIQVENLGLSYNKLNPVIDIAIQKASQYARVQGEDVAGTLQQLILTTGDLNQSLTNLNTVYDLAYLKGISAAQASDILGKAITGNISELGRLFPEIKNVAEILGKNATTSEKAAYAQAFLAEKVQGASDKMTEHEKAARRVHQAYEDLHQSVGNVIIQMGDQLIKNLKAPITYFEALTNAIDTVTAAINPNIQLAKESIFTAAEQARAIALVGSAHTRTAAEIAAASKANSDALDALNQRLKELKAPEGPNFLTAFFAGSLNMEKFKAVGLDIGNSILDGYKAADAAFDPSSLNNLNFSMAQVRIPDYQPSLDAFFAYSDELFAAQEALDNSLLDRHSAFIDQQIALESRFQQTKLDLQFAAANQAAALLSIIGQKNKVAAFAALALQKGLAIAQIYINSAVAASLAQATIPPPAGQALAASIKAWGYAQMALVAATGIAEAATSGGGGGPSGVGGGGGVGALPIQSPTISGAREAQAPTQNITVIVENGTGSKSYWQNLIEETIIPGINTAVGRNTNLTIRTR